MAVLLLAEVTDGELAMDATAKAVSAAKSLGDVTLLCAGASASAAGEAAAGHPVEFGNAGAGARRGDWGDGV